MKTANRFVWFLVGAMLAMFMYQVKTNGFVVRVNEHVYTVRLQVIE